RPPPGASPFPYTTLFRSGADVTASPSDKTQAGRSILERDPDSSGSLGIAISEAVEAAATSGGKYKYALGSVLNHVLMHQTIIGRSEEHTSELQSRENLVC